MSKLLKVNSFGSSNLMRIVERKPINSGRLSSKVNMHMKVTGKKNMVNLNDILYLRSSKNYTVFRLKNGIELLSSKTLRVYEEELEDVVNFVRPHRSFMVNFDHVKDLRFNCRGGEIYLNNEVIDISRRKAAEFRKQYGRFLAAKGENVSSIIRMKTKLKVM